MANGAALPPPAACAVEDDRFGNALIFSIIVHLAVIFGVAFTQPNPKWFDAAEKTLDVVLVNAKGARPVRAEALAQTDLDAGGEAQTPAPAPVLARTPGAVALAPAGRPGGRRRGRH